MKGLPGTKLVATHVMPSFGFDVVGFSIVHHCPSTLVSDLSRPLRENASKAECKRAQERVSGWLGNYDFVAG